MNTATKSEKYTESQRQVRIGQKVQLKVVSGEHGSWNHVWFAGTIASVSKSSGECYVKFRAFSENECPGFPLARFRWMEGDVWILEAELKDFPGAPSQEIGTN